MACKLVVVLPLFRDNGGNGCNGRRIMAPKNGKLVLEVLENNTLDRDCGGRDGGGPEEASEDTKHKATQAAQPTAATPWTPTLL